MQDKTKEIIDAAMLRILGVEPHELTPEAHIENDLGADSLDTVELLMELEKRLGIAIPDDDAEKCKTYGDICAYLEKRESELTHVGENKA